MSQGLLCVLFFKSMEFSAQRIPRERTRDSARVRSSWVRFPASGPTALPRVVSCTLLCMSRKQQQQHSNFLRPVRSRSFRVVSSARSSDLVCCESVESFVIPVREASRGTRLLLPLSVSLAIARRPGQSSSPLNGRRNLDDPSH